MPEIKSSFLNDFPQFTCVFFVHTSPILVLSQKDLVLCLVYPIKSYNQNSLHKSLIQFLIVKLICIINTKKIPNQNGLTPLFYIVQIGFFKNMKHRPSFSNEIDEDKIFKVINKNFSKIAPYWFKLMSNWLIRAYNDFGDIDKFIILIYFINKDLIFCRKNGLIIDYETFYNDKSIEIPKINISDISRDLIIPKESVRRKIQDLEKEGVIRKNGKKIFVDSFAFIKAKAKAEQTIKEVSTLLNKFNKILKDEKITNKVFTINQITVSLKNNFSFCWYQFHKLLFVFTNRWRITVDDLETLTLGLVVLLNTIGNKSFKVKDLNRENWAKIAQGADDVGVNSNSLSDITGIPRPTVTRKIKRLIEDGFLHINKKKLIIINMTSSRFKKQIKMLDQNMKSLSNMLYRIFNQIRL